MDLWEFYEHIEKLIRDLKSSGYLKLSDEVESAIRGGATSGEVLSRLSAVLPVVATDVPGYRSEVDGLAGWAKQAMEG